MICAQHKTQMCHYWLCDLQNMLFDVLIQWINKRLYCGGGGERVNLLARRLTSDVRF